MKKFSFVATTITAASMLTAVATAPAGAAVVTIVQTMPVNIAVNVGMGNQSVSITQTGVLNAARSAQIALPHTSVSTMIMQTGLTNNAKVIQHQLHLP